MKILVSSHAHAVMTPDGTCWIANPALRAAFWNRYLDVFDEVRVLARVRAVPTAPDGWGQLSAKAIHVVALPDCTGVTGYMRSMPLLRKIYRIALREKGALSMRVPSFLGTQVWSVKAKSRPYAVEVCGDPFEVCSPGAMQHPLRPFLQWYAPRNLRRMCAGACAAAYVTESALQRRYPPAPDAFSTHFSNIDLHDEAFAVFPRMARASQGPIHLVLVGSLAHMQKGVDVLIQAMRVLVKTGSDARLTVVGDGRCRSALESLVSAQGLESQVRFIGHVSSAEGVRHELDGSDLFVLPSRTEGVPKAMLEAMARGLPCIGSTVGGIPELLPPEDLVPPGDAESLARKIREVISAPGRMAGMSECNWRKAKEFRWEVLRERRIEFYRRLKEETERWLRGSRTAPPIPPHRFPGE
jgi:glycosyltransferase involved in cell wall biosynthesis